MKDTIDARPDHQGHRLPVEVGLRLPEGRGRGHRLPLDARHAARPDRGPAQPKGEHYLLEVDNPLVVPVDKKVRIITTANDVIHAWWVPAFGVKQDAIPGFVRDTWFRAEKTGTSAASASSCAARSTASCRSCVEVLSQDDYTQVGRRARRRQMAAAGRRSEQGLDAEGADRARREGLRRQLRRLPPGQRQGHAGRSRPGAGRLARS